LADFNRREQAALALLVLATLWLGLGPQAVLTVSAPALTPITRDVIAAEKP
jgi:NADH-quinone oxidoreductase subunit M